MKKGKEKKQEVEEDYLRTKDLFDFNNFHHSDYLIGLEWDLIGRD